MGTARRASITLLALAASLLATAAAAPAQTVVGHDAQGRPIHFEVLAPNVDVAWYEGLLSRAAHGDEISTVTIRIVPPEEIHDRCGYSAAACYSGRGAGMITVPAGKGREIASVFLHEYGHHLDAHRSVSGTSEPNGTPVWWALRGMAEHVRTGAVARDYRIGWDRAIGEIFAEDYAYVHVGGSYGIRWLYPPDAAFKKAFLAELRGISTRVPPAAKPAAQQKPVTIAQSGTLSPVGEHVVPFRLLGPDRQITFTAGVAPLLGSLSGARMTITCDGAVVRRARLGATRSITLAVPRIGPATCRAVLTSTTSATQRFSVKVRLTIRPSTAARR